MVIMNFIMAFYYKCFILYIFLCSVKILTNFMLLRLHLKISFYIEKFKKNLLFY